MRRFPALGISFVFFAVLAVSPAVAVADPITVTDGSLSVGGSLLPTLSLSGGGFSTAGHDRAVDAFPLASSDGKVTLSGSFKEDFDTSSVTLNGVKYNNVWVDGSFKVTGGDFDREDEDGVPFQMTGQLTGYLYNGSNPSRGHALFTETITAQGVATVDLSAPNSPAVVYSFTGASPVQASAGDFGGAASVVTPEPASLLLLGSGLALAAIRARKARNARRQIA